MTQLELNTAIFNKLNDCATSVFNRSNLSGSYTANELTKFGLSFNEIFKISIGSFYCEIIDSSIFKILSDFAKMNGFRLKKFIRKFEDFKMLGHVTFPKSAKDLCKFGDAKDFANFRNMIQFDFGINQAYAHTGYSFMGIHFSFNGNFSKRIFAPINFVQIVGTDFDVVEDNNGSVFFQNGCKRCRVDILGDDKGVNFLRFMSKQKYNEQLIFCFDVKSLKNFYNLIKKGYQYDYVTIEINKGNRNSLISFNDVSLIANLLDTPKCDFKFLISIENFKCLCHTNGTIFFNNSLKYCLCCKNEHGGIIVLTTIHIDATYFEHITEEDKPFLLYGIDL